MQQVDRARHIGFQHALDVGKVLVQERVAEAAAGIGAEHVDPAVIDGRAQLLHARRRGEVRHQRLHLGTLVAQLRGGHFDLRLIGGDDEVIAVLHAAARQFVADA